MSGVLVQSPRQKISGEFLWQLRVPAGSWHTGSGGIAQREPLGQTGSLLETRKLFGWFRCTSWRLASDRTLQRRASFYVSCVAETYGPHRRDTGAPRCLDSRRKIGQRSGRVNSSDVVIDMRSQTEFIAVASSIRSSYFCQNLSGPSAWRAAFKQLILCVSGLRRREYPERQIC